MGYKKNIHKRIKFLESKIETYSHHSNCMIYAGADCDCQISDFQKELDNLREQEAVVKKLMSENEL